MRFGWSLLFLVVLGLTLDAAPLLAEEKKAVVSVTSGSLAIGSISVEGTNLVLTAVIPSGLTQVILETHPTLDASWTEAGVLDVQPGVSEVAFTIPKPSTPTVFFRLRAKPSAEKASLISTELQFVTTQSLAARVNDRGDAVFHFKGVVDGSDKIVITRKGALWSHVNWGWPQGPVAINGQQWNPSEKNYLTTAGATAFLPEPFSLEAVQLEVMQGRDVVAVERADQALIVYLNDTPNGADTYDFEIHFRHQSREWHKSSAPSVAKLKVTADVDGSDCLKITATEAVWEHKTYSSPSHVTLNGIPWDVEAERVRKNEGSNRFLPARIDFATARIVGRHGRDMATMWSEGDAVWIRFADNPNGADAYELEIWFGR